MLIFEKSLTLSTSNKHFNKWFLKVLLRFYKKGYLSTMRLTKTVFEQSGASVVFFLFDLTFFYCYWSKVIFYNGLNYWRSFSKVDFLLLFALLNIFVLILISLLFSVLIGLYDHLFKFLQFSNFWEFKWLKSIMVPLIWWFCKCWFSYKLFRWDFSYN